MEDATLAVLCGAAAAIGFTHTLAGPDHYVPFIAMSRIGRWSMPRTLTITGLCGVGHVLSSVLIGGIALLVGWAIDLPERIESFRGDLAGWLLVMFGAVYCVWGIMRAIRNRPHSHAHFHADGTIHSHEHAHIAEHAHPHAPAGAAERDVSTARAMTPWVLFTIFVFGPCEPLIPLLMYPALQMGWAAMWVVTAVFAAVTIGTMLAIVTIGVAGLSPIRIPGLERSSHALAGFALLACGLAIQFGL